MIKLNEESMAYLNKARTLLSLKANRKHIAKETGIPYATIRTMVSRPERLENTTWIKVMELAAYYDKYCDQTTNKHDRTQKRKN